MTTITPPTAEPAVDAGTSAAPNWEFVPFDVYCARCGVTLRGQTEPRCPACALEFDWCDAVPIERLTCKNCGYHLYGLSNTRCPECGKNFDWNNALAEYHRTRLPYFEYRWRDRPLNSFLGTWWRALRPSRLWTNINLHDPPRSGGLVFMVAALVLSTYVAVGTGRAIADAGYGIYRIFFPMPWMVGRGFTTAQQLSWIISDVRYAFHNPGLSFGMALAATWVAASLFALLIFQQSMRKRRIRTRQVVRVWAYATPAALPLMMFMAAASNALPWSLFGFHLLPLRSAQGMDFVAGAAVAWLLAIRSTRLGYARYLHMRHAFGIAACAQVIALLAAFTLADAVSGYGATTLVVQAIGEWLYMW